MIIEPKKIAHMAGILVSMGYDQQLVDEVVSVLEWGNVNKPRAQVTTITHLAHAMDHIHNNNNKRGCIDDATGCSERAHGLARLLLSLLCEVGNG